MHNLEQLITEWRETITKSKLGRETLDELENHLRETTEILIRAGLSEAEAFQQAVTQLGSPPAIASEFQKLNPSTWLPIKLVIAVGTVMVVALAIFLVTQFSHPRYSAPEDFQLNIALAIHVFTVTLGYSSTFLLGFLGICFVGQRSISEGLQLPAASLKRFTFTLGCIAASLTAIAIVLGMVWARAKMGRYWGWDVKEIGGLCVIAWQICFLCAHRMRHATPRGLFVSSLLGNIVVILAWFGGNLLFNGLDSQRFGPVALTLLLAIAANLAFFLIGLAPAGWLRSAKAS